MEYACELWDSCSQQDSDKLEKLQLEAGRIVTGLPIFATKESIYFETGWELLSDRRRYRRLNMFYLIHNGNAPDYLCDLLPPLVGNMTDYNLRNNSNYNMPNCRLEITRKSFFPSTINDWNRLSQEVRNSRNINIFKRKIKLQIPEPASYFSFGDRKTNINIIHTRLRNMCSSLNADLYNVNI